MTTWKTSPDLVPYDDAVQDMEARIAAIRAGTQGETVWLLEHPPLYTAGTSAKADDLLNTQFPVHQTGRGGQYTYHGPGQRIAYVMLDLQAHGGDVRKFVFDLEEWMIRTLADFNITGERREGRIGIWVSLPSVIPAQAGIQNSGMDSHLRGNDANDEAKIAAIGVRVTRGVTWHGVSLNVNPDLSHYAGIIPCGIAEHGVTSIAQFDPAITMTDVDDALRKNFAEIF